MSSTDHIVLHRRDFLRAVVSMTAVAAFGCDAFAEASNTVESINPRTSLSYWSGTHFISPNAMVGDASLCEKGAQITVRGHHVPRTGSKPVLRVLKAHYAVQAPGGTQHVPFYGWVATPSANHRSVFHMPVQTAHGLTFSAELRSTQAVDEEIYRLEVNGHSAWPQLRAGTYVLAAGLPDWTGCRLVARQGKPTVERAGKPVDFEYLPIVVEHGS